MSIFAALHNRLENRENPTNKGFLRDVPGMPAKDFFTTEL
jgi:hypothetical protein